MGLFSFGKKTKQDTVRDSGHFVKDDDAAYTERARSKRASGGEGSRRSTARQNDPLLPEKKRARRRLVGAIALALAAAVALPMLLDSEPMPLATDIAIQIPDKDKAPALPVPSAAPASDPVSVQASVDSDEEIIDPPPSMPPESRSPAAPVAPPVQVARTETPVSAANALANQRDQATRVQLDKQLVEEKRLASERLANEKRLAAEKKLEAERKRDADKRLEAERLSAERKLEAEKKAAQASKPAKPATSQDDATRAMAILEGKAAAAQAAGPAPRYVVQVAALASQDKVSELQQRLRGAGIASFTEHAGQLIRVRIGPMSKEEADKTRSKLSAAGLSGTLVPL